MRKAILRQIQRHQKAGDTQGEQGDSATSINNLLIMRKEEVMKIVANAQFKGINLL
jgi:hypothetical protein